jgi:hypothetical protein
MVFEHGFDLAVAVDTQQVGAELIADPKLVADRLKALDVEIRAGEIAFVGRLVGDPERNLLVRIMQKDRSEPLRRPVSTD